MLKRAPIGQLNDYFLELGKRRQRGVYFYRINGYNMQIHDFLVEYHEAARLGGLIIEGNLYNPDNQMIDYFSEIIGMDFSLDKNFINSRLHKWLPRMNASQCANVSDSIFEVLSNLKNSGKNDNMLKNTYIKFMCWLYYRLERILHQLENEKLPKILYDGEITKYELLLFDVLCRAGCDIVFLQYHGDEKYLKLDPSSAVSDKLVLNGMNKFPENFNLKALRNEIRNKANMQRLYGEKPKSTPCTNAWISGKIFQDLRSPFSQRGSDSRFFYNCFCRMSGVEDKLTYVNDLFQLKSELQTANRRIVIVNKTISQPTPEEINSINRKNYQTVEQLIADMSSFFNMIVNQELKNLMHKAFIDIMLEESLLNQSDISNVNRLKNKAVFLLCWIKRYKSDLFKSWQFPEVSVFFYMGGCKNENEAMFCRFLSKLPVDVVVFVPNLNSRCCLKDKTLYEINYSESLNIEEFPEQNQGMRVGTAAYHAERELDTLMYQDSGMYRDQQYGKANAVTLQTMYEEISILWDQEMKYRPNFGIYNGTVNIPVIFSKVVGVKNGDIQAYWQDIKKLFTQDTLLVNNVPLINSAAPNNMKQFATEFFRNGKLQKKKIKEHRFYPYGILREEIQDYILDKIQVLIDRKIIKGTFENGMEYNIVATLLNLDQQTIRKIQKFDFTKKNPKIIFIVTNEAMLSIEDTIYFSFLNLIGFDVVFFVPTGYQCIERFLNTKCYEEHQIGEYKFDLKVPNLYSLPNSKREKWHNKFFRRGT